MKRVLLTGATGFVGIHCIEPLVQAGYEVIPISSKRGSQQLYQLDLFDFASIESFITRWTPTHLLHLAWYTEPPNYCQSPLNHAWHDASLHLLKVFYECGGERAVLAGTCAEYEWGHLSCEESATPCIPSTLYGKVKLSLGILSNEIAKVKMKSIAWARLFHLFGPCEHPKRLIPQAVLGLLQGHNVPCSHGQQIRDYLYVQDAASALVAVLSSELNGPVNIGSGQQEKICDILGKISEIIGNKDLIQLGLLTTADPLILVPNIDRLKRETGWSPRIGLDTGIERTINWWKNEIHNRH